MVTRNDKLFYALLKSYVLFAALLGVIILIFLALILDINNQAVEVNLLQLLLFLVLFGICSLFYALWIAKRITGPLEKIASAIQRMGEGKYNERLSIAGGYEFSVIQQRFNDMAESLERSEAENRRLQEGKRRMLADLSHDLKTPITTIQGYAKALELGIFDHEEKRERCLKGLMRRAISNLLSNALKHNPPGTQVTIRLTKKRGRLSIEITDDGIGIPDELKKFVFDPFVWGDASRWEDGGSGLGLAIVKQIAEMHGGKLHLHNMQKGTTFELVLGGSDVI